MTSLIYPPGYRPGCLLRKSKPGQICPLASERIKIIPRNEWADAAQEVTLTTKIDSILNQASVSSCAAESTTGATMIVEAVSGKPHVKLNPYALYYYTSHGRDNGSSIDENLEYLRDKGVPSQEVWPRSKGWRTKPSEEARLDALRHQGIEFFDVTSIEEMVSALLQGFPVVWGAKGHAVCKVKHIDEREGLDLNSWGEDWGQVGLGVWATYSQVNWGYGAWALRTATSGPVDVPVPAIN